jgi:hypothetical protein
MMNEHTSLNSIPTGTISSLCSHIGYYFDLVARPTWTPLYHSQFDRMNLDSCLRVDPVGIQLFVFINTFITPLFSFCLHVILDVKMKK